MSEFRKASPDLFGPYGGLGRNGQPSAGQRAANAMMSDFGRGAGQQTLEYSSSIFLGLKLVDFWSPEVRYWFFWATWASWRAPWLSSRIAFNSRSCLF